MKSFLVVRGPYLLLLVAVIWLVGAPVISLLMGAMREKVGGGFTTIHLQKVFLTREYVGPLLSTLKLSVYVGVLATLAGTLVAWVMSRLRPPGGSWLEVGIMAPIFISPFIGAVGWITLGQPNTGMLNVLLAHVGGLKINVISYAGAVFIMVLFFVPYTYTLLRHTLDRLNPELEEAAAICGANPVRAVAGVVLPLVWPSLLSAMIFTFVLAAEMFSIPGLLLAPHGFELLSYTIFERTTRWPIDQAEASAVGIILLLVTLVGMGIYAFSVRVQERFITIGPKAPRLAKSTEFTVGRAVGLVAVLLFIFCSSVLPVIAIVVRSMIPFYSGDFGLSNMSLSNIEGTLADPLVLTSLAHSLIVTGCATLLLLCLAFFVALGRVRGRHPIATLTWIVASIPIAVPGVLMGVGMIWLYIGTPIYASLSIIVLVMLSRFLPMLVRLFETGLIQLGRELDEAAAVCGARDLTITWKIRLPLLAGTIRSATTIAVTQVLNELTASALLFTSASSVLPVLIFNYMYDGDYSRASALALLQILMMGTLMGLIGLAGLMRRRSVSRARAADAAKDDLPDAALPLTPDALSIWSK